MELLAKLVRILLRLIRGGRRMVVIYLVDVVMLVCDLYRLIDLYLLLLVVVVWSVSQVMESLLWTSIIALLMLSSLLHLYLLLLPITIRTASQFILVTLVVLGWLIVILEFIHPLVNEYLLLNRETILIPEILKIV